MTEGVVRKLFAEDPVTGAVETTICIDVGYQMPIGEGGRMMTFRTLVDRGLSLDIQKRVVADMMEIGDVVKSRYELRDFEGMLVALDRRMDAVRKEHEELAERQKKRRAEKQAALDILRLDAVAMKDRAETAFRKSGRQGEFKPASSERQQMQGLAGEINRIEDEIARLVEAEESERNGALTNIAHARRDRDLCLEEIAKRKVILGVPQE